MAAGLSAAVTSKPFRSFFSSHHRPNPTPIFNPLVHHQRIAVGVRRKTGWLSVSFVLGEQKHGELQVVNREEEGSEDVGNPNIDPRILIPAHVAEKLARKRSERFTYLVAAVMSSFGITSMAVMAVYYRFSWQMEVGMEFWARWAHRALWHASLWHMHESHHRPREGAFELNDVFAIINAVPAIALLSYGFFNKGLVPGLCFGAGLGITVFGMAYMFVHDGLVHKRFQVGPIANVPYFRKVAAAHQLHHSEKFQGVPYGLFLGPKELEEVGGLEELEKEINRRIKSSKRVDESQ
ncbi:beta-carotene 3-hydroxylase 1, chloroplastic-like isoform X3 [Hibiscus syriacus]|uniref:beta-carotene 3-hydroxylase 1, chloroplastic-like isoform X3 n=1 Tax=Hibiscus syriacus TaxID=106335 RepID=UPI0019219866|nr:beta-carotene 3-hydroxylase 1, chloroplastic-like isoform X3 [Hibiscus syriacus]